LKLSRDQFEALALEQLDVLYRVARRLTRSSTGAEDLVQETFVRAIQAWQTFDLQACGIRPWLIRVLYNLHLSRAQRERRQPKGMEQEHLEAFGGGHSGGPASAHASPPPTDPTSFEHMDQRLVKAVQQLPEEYQTVLLLWAVEDMAYKEIADALDIPIGTVMSRLHRARQKLSEQLHDYAEKEGVIRE
jgi:RNA polymerase sigma-70 factor (ECF subfamily)